MNTQKQIQQIAVSDKLLDQVIALTPIHKPKDLNHLQRRQQQRAISYDMFRVAIAYGRQHFDHRGAIIYTLSDRLPAIVVAIFILALGLQPSLMVRWSEATAILLTPPTL